MLGLQVCTTMRRSKPFLGKMRQLCKSRVPEKISCCDRAVSPSNSRGLDSPYSSDNLPWGDNLPCWGGTIAPWAGAWLCHLLTLSSGQGSWAPPSPVFPYSSDWISANFSEWLSSSLWRKRPAKCSAQKLTPEFFSLLWHQGQQVTNVKRQHLQLPSSVEQ